MGGDDLVRRYVAFLADGDDALLELIDERSIDHVSRQRGPGIWRTVLGWLDASLADRSVDLHGVVEDGDRVVVWLTVHGTHVGSALPWLAGLAATHRRVAWPQVHVFRLAAGRVVEHRAVRDDGAVLDALDR